MTRIDAAVQQWVSELQQERPVNADVMQNLPARRLWTCLLRLQPPCHATPSVTPPLIPDMHPSVAHGTCGSTAGMCRSGSAQLGPVELAAAGFGLRRGKDLFAGQRGDAAQTCGRSMTASGTHSLICRVPWLTPWRQGLGAGATAQLRRGQQEGGWAGPGGPLPGGV